MKKAVIVALVALNVGLLSWLLARSVAPAQAQIRGKTDYLVVTAKSGRNNGAVVVIDLEAQKMAAFKMDVNSKRMVPYGGGRSLVKDFPGRGGNRE